MIESFFMIKEKLVTEHIINAPNWELAFELMFDASAYVVGAMLYQWNGKFFNTI